MRVDHNSRPGFAFIVSFLLLALPLPTVGNIDDTDSPQILDTTDRHRQIARMATSFVRRVHYNQSRIDDSLSSSVLDSYLDTLDGNRHYFLEPDIVYFARYRQAIDNALKSGELEPVWDIFRLYRLRAQQRLDFAIESLASEPDFSIDETYAFDREELPWPANRSAADELWRKRVKNDALSLVLTGKTWEESIEVLDKRYKRVLKRINGLDSDDVFESFMNAFVRTLDPHSSYLSPRRSEEYRIQMSLSYDGIGASLQLIDDFVTVQGIIPGGPAAIDGRLKPNDRIMAIGDDENPDLVDVVGWELDDVVDRIRGPGGTGIQLQILPGDATPGIDQYTLNLTRDKVKLEEQAAKGEIIDVETGGRSLKVGVINVPSFYQDFDARFRGEEDYVSTTRDVGRIVAEFADKDISGLIIDLRGNGGGHLSEAASLSGLFIDKGPVVQVRDTEGRVEVLDDPVPSVVYDGPMAVLVDRYSASASEIFAAAIQDYQRGVVIGQQTFGKGTVQNLIPLDQYSSRVTDPGLGQLTLTIGKYYRVTGGSTQHRGVMPDIALPGLIDASRVGESTRDRALPWDQIEATQFRADDPLDQAIAVLTEEQRSRVSEDPDMRFLLDDIEAIDDIRTQRSVSLNLEARESQREERKMERLSRENERREALGLESLPDSESFDEADRPDVLLHHAAGIVADLANIAVEPAQTARVEQKSGS